MSSLRSVAILICSVLQIGYACGQGAGTQPPRDTPAKKPETGKTAPSTNLPLSSLPAAKLMDNMCVYQYPISTASADCQAFFDQGLGFFYSYTWMEAARSLETAAKHDPDCPIVWWALSRALERFGKNTHTEALKKAHTLIDKANERERALIQARLQEKGLWPNVGDQDTRLKAASATLDELLAQYPDDEEAWYARAQLTGGSGLFGGKASSVPFYHALLRLNPLHPGANHELVHYYENCKRPALGWHYAEKYIESSPGQPHAFHMQAHLATRVGRWQKTTDRSLKAIELQKAIHKAQNASPKQDWQLSHHLETLLLGLTHDGRFAEAHQIHKECVGYGFPLPQPWFRLLLAERSYEAALKEANGFRKKDKTGGSYLSALVYLAKNDVERAAPEVQVLQQAYNTRRTDKKLEAQLWEVQGMLMCKQDGVDAGLRLLKKLVDKTKDDYRHHAWGNGAYYMEAWGIAALQAGKLEVAEEAFLEALAHDPASVRGALGMQLVCERQGRSEEAARFAELAQRCWSRAAPASLQAELQALRQTPSTAPVSAVKQPEPKQP